MNDNIVDLEEGADGTFRPRNHSYRPNEETLGAAWSWAKSHNRAIERKIIKIGLSLLGTTIFFWFLNRAGLKDLNLIPFFFGSILLVAYGLSPAALALVILTGTFTSRKSGEQIRDAYSEDVLKWVTKGLPALLFGFHVLVGFLATWSWEKNPWAFWPFAAACMTIVSTLVVYDIKGKWLPTIVITYSIGIIILSLSTSIFGDWYKTDNVQTVATTSRSVGCTSADFVADTVSSTTVPIRLDANLRCRDFIPYKSAGVPVYVRYNDGGWRLWESGNAPTSPSTIKYMDVKLAAPGAAYIKVAFGH